MTGLPLAPCWNCGGRLVDSITTPHFSDEWPAKHWVICSECLMLAIVDGASTREPTNSELFPVPQEVTDQQMRMSDAKWKREHPL